MAAVRLSGNAELMKEFFRLRVEAKTYKYGRSTIDTGINAIMTDARHRVLIDFLQAQNSDAPKPMRDVAFRFVARKRFDHSDLSRLLNVGQRELHAILKQSSAGAIAVFD